MGLSGQSLNHPWISFKDSLDHFKIDFPYQPVHMEFDLTKEDALRGHLAVYSSALHTGVLMVNVISSQALKEQLLEESFFKKVFYSCFVRRVFYKPKALKDVPFTHIEKTNVQGLPALKFSLTYPDHESQDTRKMMGLAVLKDTKLYTILVLASETSTERALFDQFIHSFHLET